MQPLPAEDRVTTRSSLFIAWGALLTASAVLWAPGCSKPEPPPIAEATGTVTLDGKPLPSVRIRFIPMFPGFGAELVAEAVSDTQGRFALTCGPANGACVGPHRVVVEEGPLPEDAQGESGRAQMRMTQYLQSLENRPLPALYGNVAQTPLQVEISADQKVYDLKLAR